MIAAAVAAGIRPCSGAIILLLFTLANGLYLLGIAGALAMALMCTSLVGWNSSKVAARSTGSRASALRSVTLRVIGVPTSVGYGASEGGQTALKAMLASCSPGLTVTNIDNGYGAACAALRILRMASE